MSSVLWLGESICTPVTLSAMLLLPVREWVLPTKNTAVERLYQPAFLGEAAARVAVEERIFYHLPLCEPAFLQNALESKDVYLLDAADISDLSAYLPARHGRMTAIGVRNPGVPWEHIPVKPEEILDQLQKELPSPETNAIYIRGGDIRCSVQNEDYEAIIERMQGK